MREFFKDVLSDKSTSRSFLASFFIIIISTVFIFFNFSKIPPFIPLFNQLPWGEQRLTQPIGIFMPILISFIIFVLNLIFANLAYKKAVLIARLLAVTTLLITILSFIFVVRTIQVIL